MTDTPETPAPPVETPQQPVAVPEPVMPPTAPESPAPPPPQWATQLQADLKALQHQVAQLQAKAPAWSQKQTAELPKKLVDRIGLTGQLRQLEQRLQKASDKQMGQSVAVLTRAVTISGKQVEKQVGQQIKDLGRRLKDMEKTLAQIQRKMK